MKILFVVPYPLGESPSQRFRFEQYLGLLSSEGHDWRVESFLSGGNWQLFYSHGRLARKLAALATGFLKRLLLLFSVPWYDIIFLHREAASAGPPVFEWVVSKMFGKRIIYDFDDAIWLTDRGDEPALQKLLRWRSKVGAICKWSYRVSCGNHFLAQFALTHNSHVVINPTTVDTERFHHPGLYERRAQNEILTIGWTGSHSTIKYLVLLAGVFRQLEVKYPQLRFLVISDQKPEMDMATPLVYRPWSLKTEIKDILEIDIGLMPLLDNEWSKGKCGLKALQYMAMEIPAVVSPVGVNASIIDHGIDGFLASTEREWIHFLETLINDRGLRKSMGKYGREKVIRSYSLSSNASTFLSLFE